MLLNLFMNISHLSLLFWVDMLLHFEFYLMWQILISIFYSSQYIL